MPIEDEKNNRFKFVSNYNNQFAFICAMSVNSDGRYVALIANPSVPEENYDLLVDKK